MDFNKPYHQLDHDDLFCKYCHKECKNKNSLLNHEIRCKNNLDKIEVYKENFNEFGHEAWNKGLTKDTDDRVRKNGESLHQSYVTGKCTPLTGDLNPSSKQEVKDKISNACLTKSANGEWHTLKLRKQEYNGVIFDSSWEVAYAKYLDNNNIKWVRCTEKFKYIYDEKIRNYTPDFYLPETDEYVEIKGYEFNPEVNNAKFNYFPKKLIVLREQQLKELNIIT